MDPSCFLSGSLIRTNLDYTPVENLKPGDMVWVASGGDCHYAPIVSMKCEEHIAVRSPYPDEAGYAVRVAANAFAEGIPFQDLEVTSKHCFLFDGRFFPVRMLINNSTISYITDRERYAYFHINLPKHEIIMANGTLTESHLDTSYGEFDCSERFAAPLDTSRVHVASIYETLQARAMLLGVPEMMVRDSSCEAVDEPSIITPDGVLCRPVRRVNDRYIYRVDGPVDQCRINTTCVRPCDVEGPFVDDRRKLGALVGEIKVFTATETLDLTAHFEKNDLSGWHEIDGPFRWTKPLAMIECPFEVDHGPHVISVQVKAFGDQRFHA